MKGMFDECIMAHKVENMVYKMLLKMNDVQLDGDSCMMIRV